MLERARVRVRAASPTPSCGRQAYRHGNRTD